MILIRYIMLSVFLWVFLLPFRFKFVAVLYGLSSELDQSLVSWPVLYTDKLPFLNKLTQVETSLFRKMFSDISMAHYVSTIGAGTCTKVSPSDDCFHKVCHNVFLSNLLIYILPLPSLIITTTNRTLTSIALAIAIYRSFPFHCNEALP